MLANWNGWCERAPFEFDRCLNMTNYKFIILNVLLRFVGAFYIDWKALSKNDDRQQERKRTANNSQKNKTIIFNDHVRHTFDTRM